MKLTFKFETGNVNWINAAELFRLAPLGVRDPEKLRRACENSFLVCFVYVEDNLIGMGRAISDGEYQAAVYDIVVLPDYQSNGIGKQIMEEIYKRLPVRTIILYSVPGKELFYEKLGYCKMLTAMARRNEGRDEFRSNGYIK